MKLKFTFNVLLLALVGGLFAAQVSLAQTNAPPWPGGLCHYSDGSVGTPDVNGNCGPDSIPYVPPTPVPVANVPNNNTPANNTPPPPVITPPATGGSSGSTLPTCDYNNPNGLCLPPNPACKAGSNSIACSGNINLLDLITKIIDYLLYFAGVIAVVFVMIGGYYYMTARGNEGQAKSGLATLRNALIGLIITILAYTIVAIVVSFFT